MTGSVFLNQTAAEQFFVLGHSCILSGIGAHKGAIIGHGYTRALICFCRRNNK